MLDRVVLARDLMDVRGAPLGVRGQVVSVESLDGARRAGPPAPLKRLSQTNLADDLHLPFADSAYRHFFRSAQVQGSVARAILAVSLPPVLFEELQGLKLVDPDRYRHALSTAAVTARMLIVAVGDAPALPDLVAAGLLHDLGMRHVSACLGGNGDPLRPEQVRELAAHPLLGAWHLSRVLGRHPAVDAALAHHWRGGRGYPTLPRRPSHAVDAVAVASAFAALTQARAFRSRPYDARGAADVLISEANAGMVGLDTVRLLVHALRGGRGDVRNVRLGRARPGHSPDVNSYTSVALAPRPSTAVRP
jgi:hypothetical protein